MRSELASTAGVGALCCALLSFVQPLTAGAQTFSRPTACGDCIANWFYFDEDSGGGVRDWNCASSSYDGHRGSDFSLAGGNAAIDTGYDVVAAADGVVERAQDGFYDHCTACGGASCGRDFGFGYGNHLVINHGSYKVTYAHMRNGSLRVGVGDRVTCGQVIGQIGSSGCTTGAHVHFETRPLGGGYTTAFDPFAGGCSPTSPSLWTSQGPHRGLPGATCGGPPPPTCPAGTYPIWTCDAALTERTRCLDGMVMTEACPDGCVSMPTGTDDVCASAPPPPDCTAGPTYSCAADGVARERCVGGMLERDPCPDGCVITPTGEDDLCRVAPDGGVDSGADASVDAAVDGGFDGGLDAGSDAGSDASSATDAGDAGAPDVERLTGGCGCDLSAAGDARRRLPVVVCSLMLLALMRRLARS